MSKNSIAIFMCTGVLLCGSVVMSFLPDPMGVEPVASIYEENNKAYKIADDQNIKINSTAMSTTTRQRVVVIDPGHAGEVTHNGEAEGTSSKFHKNSETGKFWTEYEMTLNISKLVEKKLSDKGYKVLMTRTTNSKKGDDPEKVISLEDRWKMAVNNNADAFMSIHLDGLDDSSYRGFHVIYGKESDKSYAETIRESYKAKVSIPVNSTPEIIKGLSFRPDDLVVLRPSNQTRPAVLVEIGTMTNEKDSEFLCNSSNWNLIAEGLVTGLDKYLGGPTEQITVNSGTEGYSTKSDDGLSYGSWLVIPDKYKTEGKQMYSASDYTGCGYGVAGCYWATGSINSNSKAFWQWCNLTEKCYKRISDYCDAITYQGNDYICVAVGYRIGAEIPEGTAVSVNAENTKKFEDSIGRTLHIRFTDGTYGYGVIVDTKKSNETASVDYWGHPSGNNISILEPYISPGGNQYNKTYTASNKSPAGANNFVAKLGIGDPVETDATHPWHGKTIDAIQVGPKMPYQ